MKQMSDAPFGALTVPCDMVQNIPSSVLEVVEDAVPVVAVEVVVRPRVLDVVLLAVVLVAPCGGRRGARRDRGGRGPRRRGGGGGRGRLTAMTLMTLPPPHVMGPDRPRIVSQSRSNRPLSPPRKGAAAKFRGDPSGGEDGVATPTPRTANTFLLQPGITGMVRGGPGRPTLASSIFLPVHAVSCSEPRATWQHS
jgi:hypothetical protein